MPSFKMPTIPPWLKSKNFWAVAIPASAYLTYTLYDKYQYSAIRSQQLQTAQSKYGSLPAQIESSNPKTVVVVLPKTFSDDAKARARKFLIPMLTASGIDYRWFWTSDLGGCLSRWFYSKEFNGNDNVPEGYFDFNNNNKTVLKNGMIVIGNVEETAVKDAVKIYELPELVQPKGWIYLWHGLFGCRAREQQLIGDKILSIIGKLNAQP